MQYQMTLRVKADSTLGLQQSLLWAGAHIVQGERVALTRVEVPGETGLWEAEYLITQSKAVE